MLVFLRTAVTRTVTGIIDHNVIAMVNLASVHKATKCSDDVDTRGGREFDWRSSIRPVAQKALDVILWDAEVFS